MSLVRTRQLVSAQRVCVCGMLAARALRGGASRRTVGWALRTRGVVPHTSGGGNRQCRGCCTAPHSSGLARWRSLPRACGGRLSVFTTMRLEYWRQDSPCWPSWDCCSGTSCVQHWLRREWIHTPERRLPFGGSTGSAKKIKSKSGRSTKAPPAVCVPRRRRYCRDGRSSASVSGGTSQPSEAAPSGSCSQGSSRAQARQHSAQARA